MDVVVIGSAGREHAFAWKLAQSTHINTVYVLPGNAGTAREKKCVNVPINILNNSDIVQFALDHHIDFVLIGPEAPLANGLADELQKNNISCIGPNKKAAVLESSKHFCKQFLQQQNIPTAEYATFTDTSAAINYISDKTYPIVIKADGIAAGKGVTIVYDFHEAKNVIEKNLQHHIFGEASHRIVIEEFLYGEEASFIVLCDGKHYLPLASSQDHKARDDGDLGPNTGGMGAYSPAPIITPQLEKYIMEAIVAPTFQGLEANHMTYQGFLYIGLMINPDKGTAKVLEFNVRCGDPETEVILMRLTSDFAEVCQAIIDQNLDEYSIEWDPCHALGVILASRNYPDNTITGEAITGLNDTSPPGGKVFHSGTVNRNNTVVTNGGRVLCVTALGNTLATAQSQAYELASGIYWPSVYYRKDIGHRGIKKNALFT